MPTFDAIHSTLNDVVMGEVESTPAPTQRNPPEPARETQEQVRIGTRGV
jgi:hypothetical protein